MLEANKKLVYTGDEVLSVLQEIEFILISLHKIGSYYAETLPNSYEEYAKETTNFIDNNNVCDRLANVRKVLSRKFNNDLGADDMSDIERALENIDFWEAGK
ncbi:hypothetical protein SOI71_11450 [Acinetobacter pittii]|uniref:Uncharacterized protein n=1 Tax=Acinetobacter pittii TaxID=48296 RepID=A0AB33B903_ACIPI|nr:hypothetical protein [Acinetobacter pittii]AMX18958.1 hypothetical protein IEC338SC_1822 [Acinetobacter pittii]PPB98519.1 hypothetical protein ApiMCR53_17130 [Acinetobacter pittii]WPP75968.1 hypothetical protein SOI71_11450 [Acinetobacter pittii]